MEFVVEGHFVVLDGFAEVVVVDVGEFFFEVDEFEVVGGDHADALVLGEGLDVGSAADEAFAVVGAAKNFVDEEKDREGVIGFEGGEEGFEAAYFGVKIGDAVDDGVADFDAGEEAKEAGFERCGQDGGTGIG